MLFFMELSIRIFEEQQQVYKKSVGVQWRNGFFFPSVHMADEDL